MSLIMICFISRLQLSKGRNKGNVQEIHHSQKKPLFTPFIFRLLFLDQSSIVHVLFIGYQPDRGC